MRRAPGDRNTAARRSYACLLLVAVVFAASQPAAQDVGDRFTLPEDLEITLWAESPMFFNPTNIDVDARGRVWVAEAVNYRSFNTAKQDPLTHAAGDRIVILSDEDGDGRADRTKVFVQDPDLRAPLGLAVIGSRIVVSASPHLVVYDDADADDRPDRKEILLTGFGGFDHDHGLHALVAGPDGRWYFNAGNAGPHVVTDRSGWTLRAGSLYTGGTPYNLKNQPGLVSDDGRVWTGGVALRVEPDGTRMTVLAHNFRNAYELAIDSFGDLWQNDNDDQVMTCRTTWLMEGANAGYFSADGSRYWQADRRPGQNTFSAHWHQDDPGVLPAGDNSGAGAPAGIVRYESDRLGPRYRGLLLSADAGRNVVFGYHPRPDGAGFALERFDFLSSLAVPNTNYIWDRVDQDQRKWFRPSDVAVGPDGAIYVADWFDPIVGGHQMHDRRGYGRIYRIAPKGRKLARPAVDLNTREGQVQALLNPAINVRAAGYAALKAAGSAAVPAVARVLEDANAFHRARALWLLVELGSEGVQEVERRLSDPDPQIRVTAFRALRKVKGATLTEARRLARDPSPAVRREVALALRGSRFEDSRDVFLALAEHLDPRDRWSLEAIGTGASGNEAALYAALTAARAANDPLRWDDRLAALAWRLHPAEALDAFALRAASADLPPGGRRQALAAIGFINHPRAAQVMAQLTESPLDDVSAQASWWMTYRKANEWYAYPVDGWIVGGADASPGPPAAMLERRAVVLDQAAPIDRRIESALVMAADPAGARLLLQLAAGNRLVYQLREAVGSVIFTNPDRSVRAAAAGFFNAPGGRSRMTVDGVSARAGDAERGAARFARSCSTCHRVGPESAGADLGPDLSGIHSKLDRRGLIDAIVDPGAGIALGFEAELFVTRSGESHIGFLESDAATLAIRGGDGVVRTIRRDELEARVPLKSSLMPGPLALALSEQDVADIVAFLEKLPASRGPGPR